MSRSEKQKEYILQLKNIKESKGYGYQRIVDEAESLGFYVSLSSVRRVFAEGSEDLSFRDETLRAIGRVLLETTEPTPEPVKGDTAQRWEYYEQIEALKAAVEYKTATIDQLNAELQRQAVQIDRLRTLLEKREKQFEDRDADARSLQEDVRRKDRKIAELIDRIEELRK